MTPLGRKLRSVATRYRPPWGRFETPRRPARRISATGKHPAAASEPTSPRLGRRRRLEAVLMLAAEPLPVRKLAQLANLTDGTEARTLLRDLQEAYRLRGSALSVEPVAGGYRLMTRAAVAPWIEPLAGGEEPPVLSAPAAETLAVVAYRQPVVRAEVEAIRGVQSGDLLRQLMERGLLRIVGRSEELGRPILYGTTKRFLQDYGLRSLEDLPAAEELRQRSSERRAA